MNWSQPVLRDQRRTPGGSRVAFAGTVVVHGVAVVFLFANPSAQALPTLPVYNVRLVAAPRPEPEVSFMVSDVDCNFTSLCSKELALTVNPILLP